MRIFCTRNEFTWVAFAPVPVLDKTPAEPYPPSTCLQEQRMPQNLVSLDISADEIAAMDQAIATLEALTKPFITLSADDKNSLVKMGDKSVAFCQQTALVLSQNKDALPAGFDYTEMEDDLAAYAALQGRVLRIREVLAKMDDTQTAIGSDIMVAASEGYALMKLFGKAEGLSELQQAMRVRRPGRRRKGDAAAG